MVIFSVSCRFISVILVTIDSVNSRLDTMFSFCFHLIPIRFQEVSIPGHNQSNVFMLEPEVGVMVSYPHYQDR